MNELYDIFVANYAWLNSLMYLGLCCLSAYVAYRCVYDG